MKRDLLYYLAPSVFRGMVSIFVTVPLTTYFLSPADFGVFAAVIMVSSLINAFSLFGTMMLHGYYYKLDNTQRKTMLFNSMLLAFCWNLLFCALFRWCAHWAMPHFIQSFEPVYLLYFDLSLLGILFSTTGVVTLELLVLENRSFLHGVLEIGQFITGLSANIICLTVFDMKTMALFIGPVAMGVFVSICSLIILPSRMRCHIEWSWIKEAARRELPTVVAKIGDVCANSLERFAIQNWYDLTQLGLYNHSLSYRMLLLMFNDAFRKVAAPSAIKSINENTSIEPILRLGRVWMALLGLGGVFITLFGMELLDILTHGKFVAAAPMASLWFVFIVGAAWSWFYGQYLTTTLKTKLLTLTGLTGTVFSIAAILWLVKNFGPIGAILGAGISPWVCTFIRYFFARRLGAPKFLNNSTRVVMSAFIVSFWVAYWFGAPLSGRALAFCLLAGWICIYFKLWATVRTTLEDLRRLALNIQYPSK